MLNWKRVRHELIQMPISFFNRLSTSLNLRNFVDLGQSTTVTLNTTTSSITPTFSQPEKIEPLELKPIEVPENLPEQAQFEFEMAAYDSLPQYARDLLKYYSPCSAIEMYNTYCEMGGDTTIFRQQIQNMQVYLSGNS